MLIGHHDIASYNVCFDGGQLSGVFDWALAGPTTPLLELAFIAWSCVPLRRDAGGAVTVRRVRRIGSVYGGISAVQLLDAVPVRVQAMLDWIPAGAVAGDPGLRRLMDQGEPARSQRALNDLLPRLGRLRPLLQPSNRPQDRSCAPSSSCSASRTAWWQRSTSASVNVRSAW